MSSYGLLEFRCVVAVAFNSIRSGLEDTMRIRLLSRDRTDRMLVGLGVGIGIGVLLGIVLAPRSGKDTQEWLVEKGKEGAQRVNDKVVELGSAAKRWTKARVG